MSPTEQEANDELINAAEGDYKLAGLLRQAADEFERTGAIGPVKERIIKKRLRKVRRQQRR